MNHKGLSRAFTLSALFAAMLPAMQANAAGFQVSEHSAAGLGRAFAGEAAIAEDASVIARNVAAMSFLDGPMFTGAVSYIMPDVEVENATSSGLHQGDYGKKQEGVADDAIVPVFYYSAPLDDKLSYGVGAFTHYGFTTDYSPDSGFTPDADLSEVMSYNLNAGLAYKIQENLSVGLGLSAVFVKARLTSYQTAIPAAGVSAGTVMDVEGDDWGYGWNAGVLWEPREGTKIGLSYTAEVKTTLDGKGKSDLVSAYNADGKVDLNLPSIAELSIYQQVNEKLALHASYVKIGWSSFKEVAIELDGPASPDPDVHNYSDVSRWSVGGTYQLNNAWKLRAGYAYDNSPVNNEHRSLRIPDGDRQWYTIGANYKIDNNQTIDMGYAYLKGDKEDIHSENPVTNQPIDAKITSGDAHIVSLQYNYKF